jgi:hypothetical protein
MIPNNAPKVSNNNNYILINYRDQLIQDIKQHYVNILALPRVVVMGINVNLLMEIKNCV